MLQLQNITLTMKKDLRTLIRDFTFSLLPGDKCALVGEEGNGKSTLLKLIYDANLIADYAEYSGVIHKNGLILGYLPQELCGEERAQTAYAFCCTQLGFLESSPAEIADAAARLGLPPEALYSDQLVGSLSGGEKVKLRMALLLLKRPDVLLLDEPSNDVDIETLEWMERFIRESSTPVLYISHDETLLENTANVILHMEQLRRKTLPRHTVARMGYREYIDRRLSQFAHQTQVARKEQEERRKQEARFQQIQQRVQHELRSVSRQDPHSGRLLKKKMKAVKSMEKRFERETEFQTELPDSEEAILVRFPEAVRLPEGKTVLDFQLSQLKAGGKILAENIALHVQGPRHICIVGKNGIGKTTLLKEIADVLLPRRDIRVAYMPQDYAEGLDLSMNPVEFLTGGSGKKAEITRAKTYLGSMKYTPEECAHSAAELSGGQKAKLFFLKMILDENNVLLLDEPTRNFSPLSGPVIREILRGFGGTILSTSHDRKYIREVCEAVYSLDKTGLRPVKHG